MGWRGWLVLFLRWLTASPYMPDWVWLHRLVVTARMRWEPGYARQVAKVARHASNYGMGAEKLASLAPVAGPQFGVHHHKTGYHWGERWEIRRGDVATWQGDALPLAFCAGHAHDHPDDAESCALAWLVADRREIDLQATMRCLECDRGLAGVLADRLERWLPRALAVLSIELLARWRFCYSKGGFVTLTTVWPLCSRNLTQDALWRAIRDEGVARAFQEAWVQLNDAAVPLPHQAVLAAAFDKQKSEK